MSITILQFKWQEIVTETGTGWILPWVFAAELLVAWVWFSALFVWVEGICECYNFVVAQSGKLAVLQHLL